MALVAFMRWFFHGITIRFLLYHYRYYSTTYKNCFLLVYHSISPDNELGTPRGYISNHPSYNTCHNLRHHIPAQCAGLNPCSIPPAPATTATASPPPAPAHRPASSQRAPPSKRKASPAPPASARPAGKRTSRTRPSGHPSAVTELR